MLSRRLYRTRQPPPGRSGLRCHRLPSTGQAHRALADAGWPRICSAACRNDLKHAGLGPGSEAAATMTG